MLTPAELDAMRVRYAEGIAWGEMKKHLFEYINDQIAPARAHYDELIQSPDVIEQALIEGAVRAREVSVPFMQKIRASVGIQKIRSL